MVFSAKQVGCDRSSMSDLGWFKGNTLENEFDKIYTPPLKTRCKYVIQIVTGIPKDNDPDEMKLSNKGSYKWEETSGRGKTLSQTQEIT